MKQVLQDARSGEIAVAEVPTPQLLPGCALVRIAASLVSAGTERASSEFASKSLVQKAKARPDLVREVINKVKRDGLFTTMQAVRTRLDQPGSLGYSSAGSVIAVADDVTDLRAGDRVACAGAGYAVHAEIACIPRLLMAKLPDQSLVGFDEAAFATVGAVAMHGIRTSEAKLGDVVCVIGLGLIGQLTVQILKAAGCRVLGLDLLEDRAQLALRMGADAVATSRDQFSSLCAESTAGAGVDAVLITAETSSSDPVNLAGEVTRDRGTVVAVGTVGMDLERKLYYGKELDFRVSRSYGPGRYDTAYEQKGRDYPIGYVRWTETRNMGSFIDLLASSKVNVRSLITHRFLVDEARSAYDLITGKIDEPFLGVLIEYPERTETSTRIDLDLSRHSATPQVGVGLLGAGSFAVSTLVPAMKDAGLTLVGVCSARGAGARHAGEKFGFRYCTSDEQQILSDSSINTAVISTRHHLHATQTLRALHAGKHVFCEKPLCVHEGELAEIIRFYQRPGPKPLLMVGFNRRFSPFVVRMKEFLASMHEPLAISYRVNAGYLEPDHWVHESEQGGRIVGEVCHFVDLLMFLTGSVPIEVHATSIPDNGRYSGDNVVVTIRFANGSLGTIQYLASGDRSFSKERIEVFGNGAVAVMEDFRRLELVQHGRKRSLRSRFRQDKGHQAEWQSFAEALQQGGMSPIRFEQIVATSLATLRIRDSLAFGRPMSVDVSEFVSAATQSSDTLES